MSVQGLAMVFYEKPGCINNRRQKALLIEAGFALEVRDLLLEQWQAAELKTYFAHRPVSEWFNPSAPQIKSGEIDPLAMTEQQALAAMLVEPLLIRRPLMDCQGLRRAGFDLQGLLDALGREDAHSLDDAHSHKKASLIPVPDDIETCRMGAHQQGCNSDGRRST